MKVIGITGGIGAGKTKILQFFKQEYQAYILEADKIAHDLQQPGMPCYEKIVRQFGEGILNPDKTINRKKLGEIIFRDEEKLDILNKIIHPEVKNHVIKTIEKIREQNKADYFVIEAALLIEDHYDEICDELWYIHANEKKRKERLVSSRGYSKEMIDRILKAQLSEAGFRSHCQVVLDNNDDIEQTYKQIREELKCQSK